MLLQAGANPPIKDNNDKSVLEHAADLDDCSAMKSLLDKVDSLTADVAGKILLAAARSIRNDTRLFEYLLGITVSYH